MQPYSLLGSMNVLNEQYNVTSLWLVWCGVLCWEQVLETLRNVAENMAAVMNNSLKCFSEMQNLLIHGQKTTVSDSWTLSGSL